jgi:hypothetical protein
MGKEVDRDPSQQIKQNEVPEKRKTADPADKGSLTSNKN